MIVKWYIRISSVIGTIVILKMAGEGILEGVDKAAELLQQIASIF